MLKPFPARTMTHQLEELSERFFNSQLPANWTSEKPSNDYGVDLRIDIFEETAATGLELLAQLKSSQLASTGETETIRLRTTTFNYLWDKLQVVMLIKYIQEEQEAYWLLLKDVQIPNQDQDTFTIHIPKTNRLSSINWTETQDYIRQITDEKLAARRRMQLRR